MKSSRLTSETTRRLSGLGTGKRCFRMHATRRPASRQIVHHQVRIRLGDGRHLWDVVPTLCSPVGGGAVRHGSRRGRQGHRGAPQDDQVAEPFCAACLDQLLHSVATAIHPFQLGKSSLTSFRNCVSLLLQARLLQYLGSATPAFAYSESMPSDGAHGLASSSSDSCCGAVGILSQIGQQRSALLDGITYPPFAVVRRVLLLPMLSETQLASLTACRRSIEERPRGKEGRCSHIQTACIPHTTFAHANS